VEAVVGAGALTAAFAALALLATALFRLDGKMEAGFARLDQKIDRQADRFDQRFDQVDVRFDRIDGRLSVLEIDVARHLDRHG
jgi:hypothetical protein